MPRDWIDEDEEDGEPFFESFPNAIDVVVIGLLAAMIIVSMR